MFTYVQMYKYGALRRPFRDTKLCYQLLPDCQNIVALWKVPRLRPFVLLVRAACRRRRVRNIGGLIVTGEKWNTWKKHLPRATLSTINLTWWELGSNPGLRGGRPATNCLSHCTDCKSENQSEEQWWVVDCWKWAAECWMVCWRAALSAHCDRVVRAAFGRKIWS